MSGVTEKILWQHIRMENFHSIRVARMYFSGSYKLSRWCWHWSHHEGRIHVFNSTILSLHITFLSVEMSQKQVVDWINVETHCLRKASLICDLEGDILVLGCMCVLCYILYIHSKIPLLSSIIFSIMEMG